MCRSPSPGTPPTAPTPDPPEAGGGPWGPTPSSGGTTGPGAATYDGDWWADEVMRSLIALKALTYRPTGGIVAATTTSLPEQVGGVRNWDFAAAGSRRDVHAGGAHNGGYTETRRRVARLAAARPGRRVPSDADFYGTRGERRLTESSSSGCPGYERAAGAHRQRRAGADSSSTCMARSWTPAPGPPAGVPPYDAAGPCTTGDRSPRGDVGRAGRGDLGGARPSAHFTHSKVMAWVAIDRAVQAVEKFGSAGPLDRWRECVARIHTDVCAGLQSERGTSSSSTKGSNSTRACDDSARGIPAREDPRARNRGGDRA